MKPFYFTSSYLNHRNVLSLFLLMTIINCSFASTRQDQASKVSPVVSCSWLKDNLSKPGLVVLHVSGTKLDYENGKLIEDPAKKDPSKKKKTKVKFKR